MTFIIKWVESASGKTETDCVKLPVGVLAVTRQTGVIISTDWVETIETKPCNPSLSVATHPWLTPTTPITLTLLQQGSVFRHRVWTALCEIPRGTIVTYAELAKKIDSGARAVGNACRDNPYPLIIPCHRVVSASGLGGYCGETTGHFMDIKRKLLALEAATV